MKPYSHNKISNHNDNLAKRNTECEQGFFKINSLRFFACELDEKLVGI